MPPTSQESDSSSPTAAKNAEDVLVVQQASLKPVGRPRQASVAALMDSSLA
jgi:hypothetical protein